MIESVGVVKVRRFFVQGLLVVGIAAMIASPALALAIFFAFFDTAIPFTAGTAVLANAVGTETEKFKAGEVVLVKREVCATKTLAVDSGRRLVRLTDSAYFVLESAPGMMRQGCGTAITVIQLPVVLTPGRYRYSVIVQYSNNPFHSGVLELQSPELEILP